MDLAAFHLSGWSGCWEAATPAQREHPSGEPSRRREDSAVRKAVAQVLTPVQREAVRCHY